MIKPRCFESEWENWKSYLHCQELDFKETSALMQYTFPNDAPFVGVGYSLVYTCTNPIKQILGRTSFTKIWSKLQVFTDFELIILIIIKKICISSLWVLTIYSKFPNKILPNFYTNLSMDTNYSKLCLFTHLHKADYI